MSQPTDSGSSRNAQCDREALAALAAGTLAPVERQHLLEHLQGCGDCQRTLGWLQRVDALIGMPTEGHVPAGELVRYVDGELSAAERQQVREHLDACASCSELEAAARAGLKEADAIERGIALQESWSGQRGSAGSDEEAPPLHLLATVPLPARARATAADVVEAPVPEDRRVLVEEPGLFRVVYFRRGAHGHVGLFADDPARVAVLSCRLDGDELAPATSDEDGTTYDLGAAAELPGRTLELRARVGTVERTLCWTFIGE